MTLKIKKTRLILPIVALFFATSCEEKLKTWSGEDRINFSAPSLNDTLIFQTFVLESPDATQLTVWLDVGTEGFVYNFPRTVTIRQVPSYEGNDAAPGVHYVAFDDTQTKQHLIIPAGTAAARIPIILLRDSSLTTEQKALRIELVENNYFLLTANRHRQHRTIVFTDRFIMPQIWNEPGRVREFFGTYGQAKHRFMVETTGMAFDDEWFANNFWWQLATLRWVPNDETYVHFLQHLLQRRLNERNELVGTPLKEDDGTIVDFFDYR